MIGSSSFKQLMISSVEQNDFTASDEFGFIDINLEPKIWMVSEAEDKLVEVKQLKREGFPAQTGIFENTVQTIQEYNPNAILQEKVDAFILSSHLNPSRITKKIENRIRASFRPHEITNTAGHGILFKKRKNQSCVSIEESGNNAYALISYPLGKGKFKNVKLAIRTSDHQCFARATGPLNAATMTKLQLEKSLNAIVQELEMQRLFDQDEEFVQIIHGHKFISSKSSLEKFAILMEYCPDGDLSKYIQNHEIPEEVRNLQLIHYFYDILSALKKMEERKIIHRDIKPENIFLKGNHAKIGDFGFCVTEEQQRAELLASPDTVAGTPFYLSPEYYVRKQYIDKKLTIYKLSLKSNIQKLIDLDKKKFNSEEKKQLSKAKENDEIIMDRLTRMLEYRDKLVPKSDFWAMGLIIYQTLYKDHLYRHLNNGPIKGHVQLTSLLCLISQEQINQLFKPFQENSFEHKMCEVMKKILVLDVRQRPSAKELLEFYSDMFKEELAK